MFILNSNHFLNISQGQQVFELWKKENRDENLLRDSSTFSSQRDAIFFTSEKAWYLNATLDYVIDPYNVLTHILTL